MIKLKIKYGNSQTDLRFPCTEKEMNAALERIHAEDVTPLELYLHHAVGALAQMRVLHILDALQLRHHLGRIHQRTVPLLWGGGLGDCPAGFLLLGALLL